jgi:hypothetical protein
MRISSDGVTERVMNVLGTRNLANSWWFVAGVTRLEEMKRPLSTTGVLSTVKRFA